MTASEQQALEFSFPVDLATLDPSGARFTVEASAAERPRIARRLGAPAVDALTGDFTLTPTATGLSVEGRLRARLRRQCVVSLETLTEQIDEPFTIAFAREPASEPDREEALSEEPVELLEGASVDLGELLVQELALAMNPYPRKAGAPPLDAASGPSQADSPFAVLAAGVAEPDQQE